MKTFGLQKQFTGISKSQFISLFNNNNNNISTNSVRFKQNKTTIIIKP